MREIKLRAWDRKRKQILEVFHWHKGVKADLVTVNTGFNKSELLTVGEDVELIQYTGLKDKKGYGDELWEGDIVKAGNLDMVMVITYHKSGFYLAFPDGGISAPLWPFIVSEYIERIGNIYENPELLK